MTCSVKVGGLSFSGLSQGAFGSREKTVLGIRSPTCSLKLVNPKSRCFRVLGFDFMGRSLSLSDQKGSKSWGFKAPNRSSINTQIQSSFYIGRAQRWWEKSLQPNMVEIHSAQELVDSLLGAGDRLAILDFYSPGCGGCRALHPKICQLAEQNPSALFLKVNYDELKSMCYSLHVHVLPFFRFYRGAEGRVCSFSCTSATIKKFKDALAKYGTARCGLGSAKGLDQSELKKLESAGLISLDYPLDSSRGKEGVQDLVIDRAAISVAVVGQTGGKIMGVNEDNAALMV